MLGWSSPAQILVVHHDAYGFPVTEEEWSWVSSSATLGAAVSCVFIGYIINSIGRKGGMLALIIPYTCGWSLLIWPQSVWMLYIGRFISGLAGGAFFVAAPIYIGEISMKECRGKLGSYFQLMVTGGIVFVYTVGYFFSVMTFTILCAALPLVFGVVFILMPESPYFYVMKNKSALAIGSLKWLRGAGYNYTPDLQEMHNEHELASTRANITDALLTRAMKRAVATMLGLMVFVQLSGINVVIFYTGIIFDSAHIQIDSTQATILVGLMQVAATYVASLTVDRLGRRINLLTSISLMSLCNVALGLYFYLLNHSPEHTESLGWLPVVAVCVFIIAYSLGLGPMPWVLIGELFTTEVKGVASSACGTVAWIAAFTVTKTFPNIRDWIGIGETFWMFAVFSAVGSVFIWYAIPETKGKTFAEIQQILDGQRSPHDREAAD